VSRPIVLVLLILAFDAPANAQPIYTTTPQWVSADTPYSTGGALVDLDRDGWLDFVVANGNDMARQKLVVYYNLGDGTFPASPDWQSADLEYNGHLSIADVDGDSWLDVAVGLTMDDPGTATARLYLNNAGTLSSTPDWTSSHQLAAFHVAFGDVNGDGRPDLAVGTSFPYASPSHPWHNYVHMNVGGTLETSPSWVSDDTWDLGDIFFCDVNADGWLDLAGLGENTVTHVYVNNNGTLATTATWQTTDNPGQFTVFGTYGDVDGDGLTDLFATDNTQLFTGSGLIRRYDGLPGGFFTTTPTWTHFEDYGSAAALADIDADGDLDLATGSWWGFTHYLLNNAGTFPPAPSWQSAGDSVVETIYFGDVDNDGLRYPWASFDVTGTPNRHLFQLPHQPVDQVIEVTVDGMPLTPGQYTYDPVHGWVTVGPSGTNSVAVHYAYSLKPDMAITNWDNQGNQLYYNQNDQALCGDGVLDEGELCDTGIAAGQPGACPTECDSGDPCISAVLLSGGTCLAHCEFSAITEPRHGDGCCPPGANAANDDDCDPVCGNDVCEPGEQSTCIIDCDCVENVDCDDDYVCTFDQCLGGTCSYQPKRYGDVDNNGAITLADLFCVLDGFAGDFSTCSFSDDDIQPCAGNGFITLADLFAVLDAYAGEDPCCGG